MNRIRKFSLERMRLLNQVPYRSYYNSFMDTFVRQKSYYDYLEPNKQIFTKQLPYGITYNVWSYPNKTTIINFKNSNGSFSTQHTFLNIPSNEDFDNISTQFMNDVKKRGK